jgi:hypothetical protein
VINIACTYAAYEALNIYDRLHTCLILGDDNWSIFQGKLDRPDLVMIRLKAAYARLGLTVKVKYHENIAKSEFCNMIFAPTLLPCGTPSYTMISKLYRLVLKFNGVRKAAITGTLDSYIRDNLHAIRNTLQFYPGL